MILYQTKLEITKKLETFILILFNVYINMYISVIGKGKKNICLKWESNDYYAIYLVCARSFVISAFDIRSIFLFFFSICKHTQYAKSTLNRKALFDDRNLIWFLSKFNTSCRIWKLYLSNIRIIDSIRVGSTQLHYLEVLSFDRTYDSGAFFVCLVIFTSLSLSLLLGFAGLIIFVWLLFYTTQYLLGILKHLIGRKLILNILASRIGVCVRKLSISKECTQMQRHVCC